MTRRLNVLSRNRIPGITTRKISNSMSAYIPAVLVVMVGFTECWMPATLTPLTLSAGMNGTSTSGYMADYLDLVNKYAGTSVNVNQIFSSRYKSTKR